MERRGELTSPEFYLTLSHLHLFVVLDWHVGGDIDYVLLVERKFSLVFLVFYLLICLVYGVEVLVLQYPKSKIRYSFAEGLLRYE